MIQLFPGYPIINLPNSDLDFGYNFADTANRVLKSPTEVTEFIENCKN